jgi:hypothetical protein
MTVRKGKVPRAGAELPFAKSMQGFSAVLPTPAAPAVVLLVLNAAVAWLRRDQAARVAPRLVMASQMAPNNA